ncbi:MAG: hypothetical protein Q8K32_05045 [Archangium sp.]|nr:hypothetical protein [Archangium sp.]
MRRLIQLVCGASVSLVCAALFMGCGFEIGVLGTYDAGPSDNAYECGCECEKAVLTLTPSASPKQSSDDAEELLATGAMTLNGVNLDMVVPPEGQQAVGLRFPQLGLPRGAIIETATIQFTTSVASSVATTLFFRIEAADNAAPFTTTAGNLSGRTPTGAVVHWDPLPWNTVGQNGAAQRTLDLKTLVQDVVDRAGWQPGNAMVVLITGTGLRRAVSFDQNPGQAPRLVITYRDPSVTFVLPVCMPATLNPNNGNAAPTAEQLRADCEGRVENTVRGLTQTCGYPSACNCTPTPAITVFQASCNDPCVETPLAAGCTNFNPEVAGGTTATNAPGDTPVCTTNSPLASAMFGKRSACNVSGTGLVQVPDESDKHPAVSGLIEFIGAPCPGASCAVGMATRLQLANVTYSHTFGSRTFSDLGALSESLPGQEATLNASGTGLFAPGSNGLAAHGRSGSDEQAVVGANNDALAITVDWSAATCHVSGALIGVADPELSRCENAGPFANEICADDAACGEDPECSDGVCNCVQVEDVGVTMAMTVAGPLVNQPPRANAGVDQTVECNQAGGASLGLDGSGSTDPDSNLASFTWFSGTRAGTIIGHQSNASIVQAAATSATYVLRAIDRAGQADEDSVGVAVVDTTPPVIACNNPPAIIPPRAPVAYTASATDVCDPGVAAVVTAVECFKISPNGNRVPKDKACGATFTGATLNLPKGGGVDDQIQWTVRAVDLAGNVTTRTCEVRVVNRL